MLIKIIALSGDIHIISNVDDVSVLRGDKSYSPNDPAPHPMKDFFFDWLDTNDPYEPDHDKVYSVREIHFSKDGPCRLFVARLAYICNDDGRTIEKVVAGPEFV